ncbi:putative Zinc finger C-x8-C-x5-C-x3-H type (and similar) [Leishmania utingensis]|uniref:Zinc finger C-x8-C-x5-C-x3-H type (And similar) n=1 Tax=Leishmania utingensis TaxID=653362 RepID=A0AAW3B4N4_9TRYP
MASQSHMAMSKHTDAVAEHHKRIFQAAGDNNEEEKHILAGRYKTKLCKNYVAKGECPYDVRCMFAHGEEELRTTDDNIRDGLTTEEAIKGFQRQQNQAKRRAAFATGREHNSHDHHSSHSHIVRTASHRNGYEVEEASENDEVCRNHHRHHSLCLLRQNESVSTPQQQQQQQFQLQSVMTQCYTHNPYVFDLIPSAARLFPVYREMIEEGCWYEEESVPAPEDYYFPSSDMMMPLVPSLVTQQYPQYPHTQCGKQFETGASVSNYTGEEVMYGHSESSASSMYRSMARCTAAELPSNSDIPAMVMEP